jgi:hypothetical protein
MIPNGFLQFIFGSFLDGEASWWIYKSSTFVWRNSMTFPDPISFAADFVTILGIPLLAFSTYKTWREIKEERAEQNKLKKVSQDCLEFYNRDERVGINLVPLTTVVAIPRVGDTLFLPGETRD